MTELEWASDGHFVDPDRDVEVYNDPEEDGYTTYDVPADAVEEYLARPGWERPGEADGEGADTAAEDDSGSDTDDEVDALLEGTVDEVADALETGEYDDRLDDIESRDDRQGVADAIDDRRDALEDED